MGATENADAADRLRAQLKEQGLERTVQLMTVPERGEARRLIRAALELYATHQRSFGAILDVKPQGTR